MGALDELEEAVEEDEELQRERNDKAVQMQYMVRLARLYNQADRINSSSAIPGRDIIGGGSSEIESEELIMGVGDYSTSLSEVDTQQISDSSTVVQVATKLTTLNTENDVFSIMKRQRLERKRRREISRADEDTNETEGTSAVYDWTSKSI